MLPLKLCLNGHHKFEPTRVDQIFCNAKCKNAFNNRQYKKELAVYKKIMDRLRAADKVFDSLYNKDGSSLLPLDLFKEYHVSFDDALQLHFDSTKNIIKAIYAKYKLTLISNKIYKLEKI